TSPPSIPPTALRRSASASLIIIRPGFRAAALRSPGAWDAVIPGDTRTGGQATDPADPVASGSAIAEDRTRNPGGFSLGPLPGFRSVLVAPQDAWETRLIGSRRSH